MARSIYGGLKYIRGRSGVRFLHTIPKQRKKISGVCSSPKFLTPNPNTCQPHISHISMAGSKIVFREYTNDDSFTKLTDIPKDVSEIQVALTFARDYDGVGSTQGKFIPYWDTAIVNPDVIANFKSKYPSAKVLVSIGNNKRHFPFKIDEDRVTAWINAATESLTRIIKEYNLDGIDVYYEDIEVSNPAIFVHCIGELIKTLKLNKVITRASISPNIEINDNFYRSLHQNFEDHIDYVNLFLSVVENLTGNTNQEEVLEKLKPTLNQYPPIKRLLGYSSIPPPPIFFVVSKILLSHSFINGISLKVTSFSITYFPPQWILDLLQSPLAILGSCKCNL